MVIPSLELGSKIVQNEIIGDLGFSVSGAVSIREVCRFFLIRSWCSTIKPRFDKSDINIETKLKACKPSTLVRCFVLQNHEKYILK